jgi:hypothetical protein
MSRVRRTERGSVGGAVLALLLLLALAFGVWWFDPTLWASFASAWASFWSTLGL